MLSGDAPQPMRRALTRRLFGALALAFVGWAVPVGAQEAASDIARLTLSGGGPAELRVSFIAISLADGRRWRLAGSDVDRAVPPYETFDIPNMLIGLQQGAITGRDHMRARDQNIHPARPGWPEAWLADQDLESAFTNAVPWYFEQVAQEVRGSGYRPYLRQWRYGNTDAGFANTMFWRDGTLLISPAEKLGFMARLAAGFFDLPEADMALLDTLSAQGEVAGQPLFARAGMGERVRGGGAGGWYVGWVGARPAPVVFALYAEGPDFDALRDQRRALALDLLEQVLR